MHRWTFRVVLFVVFAAQAQAQAPEPIRGSAPDTAAHREALRHRLARGDEDSLVNLWLYGTSFTRLPPARGEDNTAALRRARLADFLSAIETPGANERLLFARAFLAGQSAGPLLERAYTRALAEFARTDDALRDARHARDPATELAVHSSIFRDRGLSSDTSILVDFALDRALAALTAGNVLATGSVRRIGVVGPGLDVINKADGHDFYPEQTLQPFVLIDSLLRLGLAEPASLRLTTFDVSDRVNHHIEQARHRAQQGQPYIVHLPLSRAEAWAPDLLEYRAQIGRRIGAEVRGATPPADQDVMVRALAVRPDIVRAVEARDVDIVTEYVEVAPDAGFDLIVATNVFVYYAPSEQARAVENVARMLRPGGVLLSNTDVPPTAAMQPAVGHLAVAYSSRQNDHVFVYQRR